MEENIQRIKTWQALSASYARSAEYYRESYKIRPLKKTAKAYNKAATLSAACAKAGRILRNNETLEDHK